MQNATLFIDFMDFSYLALILQGFHILHISYNHECDLEGNRVFKHTKIQSCTLLKLVQTINQCISVNIKLSGCLRNIQTILCLLYTSPSPRDRQKSRMPSSA